MRTIVLERARTLRGNDLREPRENPDRTRVELRYAPIRRRDLDAYYYGLGKMPRVFGSTAIGKVVSEGERLPRSGRIIPFPSSGSAQITRGTPVIVSFNEEEEGALREVLSVETDRCHPFDLELEDKIVPLIPDVAVAASRLATLRTDPGDLLVVFGAEVEGILLSLIAQMSELQVVLVDTRQANLDRAAELGVDHRVNPIHGGLPEEIEWFRSNGVEHVVDTTGDAAVLPSAYAIAHPGTRLALCAPIDESLSLREVVESGLHIVPIFDVEPDIAEALRWAPSLPLDRIPIVAVPLEEVPFALPAFARSGDGTTQIIAISGDPPADR